MATTAGRGVILIAFAKFWFMFAGLVTQFRLPAILTRTEFGAYTLVSNIASLVNNVVVTGTIQTVSKFSANDPGKARAVQLAGLRMHVRLGLPIAAGFVAAAPIVSHFLHDSSKTAPLMLAGLIIGGYSFYAVFVGTANGLHEFHKQAGLDITFATLRVAGLLGMALAGLGVIGVIGGWVAAVGIIFATSVAWVGLPGKIAPEDRIPVKPLLTFFAGVAVYLVLFNALMFVDSILIKRLATEYFAAHRVELDQAVAQVLPWAPGLSGYSAEPSSLADVQNAYYGAVQNLGRLSYQAILAASFVVFPLVSKSTFDQDKETTQRYVEITLRYSLIFALMIGVVMIANPVDVLGLIYAPDYAQLGGSALAALAIGNVAFSIFAIAGTILNGAGYTKDAIIVAAITLVIAIVADYAAIATTAGTEHMLAAAGAATGGAMLVGSVLVGFVLRRRLGIAIKPLTLVRVLVAGAAAVVVGRVLPLHGKLMTLVEAGAVAGTFLVVLVATRELGKRDLQTIKAVRAKRAKGGTET